MEYLATGKIRLGGGASPIILKQDYRTKYGVGVTVYVKNKARKGKLEKITIKKVNLIKSVSSAYGVANVINYVDTFNRVWLENELSWQDEAVQLAINYYEILGEKIESILIINSAEAR